MGFKKYLNESKEAWKKAGSSAAQKLKNVDKKKLRKYSARYLSNLPGAYGEQGRKELRKLRRIKKKKKKSGKKIKKVIIYQ